MKNNLVKRTLPVKLTRDEVQAMGQRSAHAARRQVKLEERKKLITQRFTKRIEETKKEIGHASECIITGYEDREVECEVVRLAASKMVEIRRCDTGAVVESRAMTERESQMAIEDYIGKVDLDGETKDRRDEIGDEAHLEAEAAAKVPEKV